MRKLPPLNALRVFECAARHQSVSLAAEELCVTHGAVSKQVKQLEAWLNTRLFEQTGRRITLTVSGQRLYRHSTLFLDNLADACAQIADSRGRTFRIHAAPTLAMRWLLPRLTNFQARQMGIKLSLSTGSGGDQELADVILGRDGKSSDSHAAYRFMTERETPMCTPRYRAGLDIRRVEDLGRACWLNSDLRTESWAEWLQLTDTPAMQPAQWIRFGQYYLALQAAFDGLGILLGSLPLVADELATGRLVPLFPELTLQHHTYTALVRKDRAEDAVADDFVAWLMEEAPGS
jgi:LysR family glycine cleavage system transcriptional activator